MARQKKRRQWGSGEIDQTTTGWQIRWRENGRRRTRGGFGSEDDARRVLAKIKGDIAQGKTGLPPDARGLKTISEYALELIERRKISHRSADCDGYRWNKHLAGHFGHLKPSAVDTARIRAFVEMKLAELAPGTIRIMVTFLSQMYIDLIERGLVQFNPARDLPESLLRLMRSKHDPRTVPFIEQLADVRRIYLDLEEPLNIAYAIGALAGLRTGEVFALRWPQVDVGARRIHVIESVKGPLKDDDSRIVPILDSLLPILKAWKLETGGRGRVIPSMRQDGEKISKETPGKYLRATLAKLELARPGLLWYEATRHTFASQWVLAGNSIEKLATILGHYSVVMTERYAHLRPDLFSDKDLSTLALDMSPGAFVGTLGRDLATEARS